jgi:23S rRNA (cytidine1920-2'-O)/16S rRNA (cytidine1409-2'-O)-methyltransferase
MSVKQRVDLLLVERGLVTSRERAQAAVLAGSVRIGERPVLKVGERVPIDSVIRVTASAPYVSRGGEKLAHALHVFGADVSGKICLDMGASTGGFTDCLLQQGASRVYAVDVGYGQLDYRLRTDPRVTVMDRTNARHLPDLPEVVDLCTIDVSFISLEKVIPAAVRQLRHGGHIIALLKPQFQGQRHEVGKGGVVRDTQTHANIIARFTSWAIERKLWVLNMTTSPLLGPAGNREFLLLLGWEGGQIDLADEDRERSDYRPSRRRRRS